MAPGKELLSKDNDNKTFSDLCHLSAVSVDIAK